MLFRSMAYLTIYNVAATADEVTALYESVDEEIVAPSGNPSSPSPSASADPSEDPSEEPSSGNDSTTPPSSDNDNPSTFDAGILSLGVMALSSCLAMRKRR